MKNRDIKIDLKDSFKIRDKVKTKSKAIIDGKTKIIHEQKIGDDYYKKTKKWNFLHRIIDRCNNKYYELIKDGKTGEVIIKTEEKLSEHQGHGSAKREE